MGCSCREDIATGDSVLQQKDRHFLLRTRIRKLFRVEEVGGEGGE